MINVEKEGRQREPQMEIILMEELLTGKYIEKYRKAHYQ